MRDITSASETIRKPTLVEAKNAVGKQINTAKNGRHISVYGWDRTRPTSGIEKQTPAILKFFFRLLLRLSLVIGVLFRIKLPNFVHRDTRGGVMTSMAAAVGEYYFHFRIWWCHSHPTVKIYPQTKFRRYIHSWDITTSALEKQTPAILEFFFPFRYWPDCSNLHAILSQVRKFCPNLAIRGGVMMEYAISRWQPRWRSTTSGFVFNVVTLFNIYL